MNITRNTMRADGLTVGQALDRDAAHLRALGIPAKDGALTIDERREEFINVMRDSVLDAMDLASATLRQDGPKDQELSLLFKGVDAIANRVFDDSLNS